MRATNKRLTILSNAEQAALYELPEFDDIQRQEYFTFTEPEQQLFFSRPTRAAQVYCALQIGYFKAKQLFFQFDGCEVEIDVDFIVSSYFSPQVIEEIIISKHEHYTQCVKIAKLFGYQRWAKLHNKKVSDHLTLLIKRDITTPFIVIELLAFLKKEKIIRPGYTTFQNLISNALTSERKRLIALIKHGLSKEAKDEMQKLLLKEDTLSGLAALKQDAKNFKTQMMINERNKLLKLKPFYVIAKSLLPALALSQKNIQYYASLADYYSIRELREKLLPELTQLYLLCYAWQRYRQINDNLVDAFCYHLNQVNMESKVIASNSFANYLAEQQDENILMRKLAHFWVDKTIADNISFGNIRKAVFKIVPEKELAEKIALNNNALRKIHFKWKAIDDMANRIKINLRPIMIALDIESELPDNKWIAAIAWLKAIFSNKSNLRACPVLECPEGTIPKRLQNYLLETNACHQATLRAERYEYWIYRQLRKQIQVGEIYLDDSIRHRSFSQELAATEQQSLVQNEINAPALRVPIKIQLDALFTELNEQWLLFDRELKEGKLTHLRYDFNSRTLHSQKIKKDEENESEKLQLAFYNQLPLTDITDVLRFVSKECRFLKAFTPLQSRYAKQDSIENSLLAVIIAQAMNHGNLNMAQISNIPYHSLQTVYKAYCRTQTVKLSNDIISNAISGLSIFPFYSLDLALLYSAVDGQKFEVRYETTKARHSKKHFGKVKGVVAYTLLANQTPLQLELISPNDHESYYVFDIWYNNTTTIVPDVVTGDMHCINKANFAIMQWFGAQLYPRFTNVQDQLKHLFCSPGKLDDYQHFLIQPIGEIDRQLIEDEWPNLKSIIVALGLKEISQSILVKKLCNYTVNNRTRKALFEYDKLIRSIYTLKYLRDPTLQQNVHRSQNRIESYHQLRGAIAQAYGRKQLSGKTDVAIAISNECGRLIANAIIYYNSVILSKLKDRFEADGNSKGLEMLKKISPVAWQHIHFLGHYLFSEDFYLDIDLLVNKLLAEQSIL